MGIWIRKQDTIDYEDHAQLICVEAVELKIYWGEHEKAPAHVLGYAGGRCYDLGYYSSVESGELELTSIENFIVEGGNGIYYMNDEDFWVNLEKEEE